MICIFRLRWSGMRWEFERLAKWMQGRRHDSELVDRKLCYITLCDTSAARLSLASIAPDFHHIVTWFEQIESVVQNFLAVRDDCEVVLCYALYITRVVYLTLQSWQFMNTIEQLQYIYSAFLLTRHNDKSLITPEILIYMRFRGHCVIIRQKMGLKTEGCGKIDMLLKSLRFCLKIKILVWGKRQKSNFSIYIRFPIEIGLGKVNHPRKSGAFSVRIFAGLELWLVFIFADNVDWKSSFSCVSLKSPKGDSRREAMIVGMSCIFLREVDETSAKLARHGQKLAIWSVNHTVTLSSNACEGLPYIFAHPDYDHRSAVYFYAFWYNHSISCMICDIFLRILIQQQYIVHDLRYISTHFDTTTIYCAWSVIYFYAFWYNYNISCMVCGIFNAFW